MPDCSGIPAKIQTDYKKWIFKVEADHRDGYATFFDNGGPDIPPPPPVLGQQSEQSQVKETPCMLRLWFKSNKKLFQFIEKRKSQGRPVSEFYFKSDDGITTLSYPNSVALLVESTSTEPPIVFAKTNYKQQAALCHEAGEILRANAFWSRQFLPSENFDTPNLSSWSSGEPTIGLYCSANPYYYDLDSYVRVLKSRAQEGLDLTQDTVELNGKSHTIYHMIIIQGKVVGL